MKPKMLEQKIYPLFCSGYRERILLSDKCEAPSKFEKELDDIIDESLFQQLLIIILLNRQEVEIIRVFGHFLSQITLGSWKGILEITDCLSLSLIEIRIEEIHQNCSGPVVLNRLSDKENRLPNIPVTAIQYQSVMSPRNRKQF